MKRVSNSFLCHVDRLHATYMDVFFMYDNIVFFEYTTRSTRGPHLSRVLHVILQDRLHCILVAKKTRIKFKG